MIQQSNDPKIQCPVVQMVQSAPFGPRNEHEGLAIKSIDSKRAFQNLHRNEDSHKWGSPANWKRACP